jgi:hypothetical protein
MVNGSRYISDLEFFFRNRSFSWTSHRLYTTTTKVGNGAQALGQTSMISFKWPTSLSSLQRQACKTQALQKCFGTTKKNNIVKRVHCAHILPSSGLSKLTYLTPSSDPEERQGPSWLGRMCTQPLCSLQRKLPYLLLKWINSVI